MLSVGSPLPRPAVGAVALVVQAAALRRFIPASLVSRLNPFLFISVATGIASFSVFILSRSLGDAFTYSCLPYQTLLPKLLLPPYQTLLL